MTVTTGKRLSSYPFRTVLLKVWSLNQKHYNHLEKIQIHRSCPRYTASLGVGLGICILKVSPDDSFVC